MTTGSHSEPCINWPCTKGAGHAGPCGTSSKEQLAEILSDAHAIYCAAEVGMPCDCRVPAAIAELLDTIRALLAERDALRAERDDIG